MNEIYPDKHSEIISICRSHVNGVITSKTTNQEKVKYGWKILEQLRILENLWLGDEEETK